MSRGRGEPHRQPDNELCFTKAGGIAGLRKAFKTVKLGQFGQVGGLDVKRPQVGATPRSAHPVAL